MAATSFDLPMPGSPMSSMIRPSPAWAPAKAARISATSRVRPTSGVARWPSRSRRPRGAPTTCACTGADLPLTTNGASGSRWKSVRRRSRSSSVATTVPHAAWPITRAARFTASPITVNVRRDGLPRSTAKIRPRCIARPHGDGRGDGYGDDLLHGQQQAVLVVVGGRRHAGREDHLAAVAVDVGPDEATRRGRGSSPGPGRRTTAARGRPPPARAARAAGRSRRTSRRRRWPGGARRPCGHRRGARGARRGCRRWRGRPLGASPGPPPRSAARRSRKVPGPCSVDVDGLELARGRRRRGGPGCGPAAPSSSRVRLTPGPDEHELLVRGARRRRRGTSRSAPPSRCRAWRARDRSPAAAGRAGRPASRARRRPRAGRGAVPGRR